MSLLANLLPRWLSNDSAATAQALVADRDAALATNTDTSDKIAAMEKRLQVCCKAVQEANPTLSATLNAPDHVLSDREMAELLKILTLASVTDCEGLSQDLESFRKKREQLGQLLQSLEKVEAHYDAALKSGSNAQNLNEKTIQDLTAARQKMRQLGVQPTCHGISDL
jgi:exonuclease VII small subunit